MIIQETKVFRDNVHGYIKVPLDYVNCFIDTDIFQRLRQIEQTGMRVLYPSARHDRFIHSLGTYHLGHKAYKGFRNNVYRRYHIENNNMNDHYQIYKDDNENEKFWTKCQVLFEIACLLHDCGHAPFSHTLEFHYDKEPIYGNVSLKNKLKSYLGSQEFKDDFDGQGAPHERMSALLVCSEFQDAINNILKKNDLMELDDGDPIEFVVRMIIGCEYSFCNSRNQIKNCFIQLLNSDSIDVDSLDYIIRDAKLSGIDNMNIDVDRILGSLTLIEKTSIENGKCNNIKIKSVIVGGSLINSDSKLAEFKGKCRGSMLARENCCGSAEGRLELKGSFKSKREVKVLSETGKEGKIFVNGAGYKDKLNPTEEIVSIQLDGVIPDKLDFVGAAMDFGDKTNGKIEVKAKSICFNSAFVDGTLNGSFTGEILGDYSSDIYGSKLKCSLGFHKSSLSVIQNVIIARNYEYQWIYSHHKVVYYANYLLIDLLNNCIDYLMNKGKKENKNEMNVDDEIAKLFSWKTMLDSDEKEPYIIDNQKYFRVNDSDILSLYKKCRLEVKSDTFLGRQLNEYFQRKYKKSLWKSYAEFHILFSEFTDTEKEKIFEFLCKNSKMHLAEQYGYLNENLEKKFQEFGLCNVVWVNGDSKLKTLNPDNTYILFKNNPMSFRSISSVNDIKSMEKLNLFYIYYEPIHDNVDIKGLLDYIKTQLK